VSTAGFAVFGYSPAGNLLIYPLEHRFPPWDASRGAPDGIIILGGAIGPDASGANDGAALNESAERVTAAAGLARRYPQARIVYSGGNGDLFASGRTEAEFALPLLESFGIERARIALEDRSRTTYENAAFSKELVKPKLGERWLIVTSAHHMPRSIGVFRAVGFPVEAYPVDWRTGSTLMVLRRNASGGLQRTDTAMHEWIGLAAYFLAGRTSEFFPAPR
jgi:uncharacterized SAM-binding protein YcdF (DUF218 family)